MVECVERLAPCARARPQAGMRHARPVERLGGMRHHAGVPSWSLASGRNATAERHSMCGYRQRASARFLRMVERPHAPRARALGSNRVSQAGPRVVAAAAYDCAHGRFCHCPPTGRKVVRMENTKRGSVRVRRLSRQDVLRTRCEVVERNGLSLPFLEELERREGTDRLIDWLEDHNFWGLADDWKLWSWLLGE